MKPPKISKAVKYGLAFFNGVFWVLSLLLIGAGYYSITSSDTAAVKTTSIFAVVLNISVLLLLVGLVMFVISLAGILGTLRENLPLLQFYRRCIIVLLFLEFGITIFCYGFSSYINRLVSRDLPQRTVAAYRDDANMQNLLDFLQQQFHCCGVTVNGFLDWSDNMYFNCSPTNPSVERCSVPWSCCVDPDKKPIRDLTCGRGVQELTAIEASERIHTDGCVGAVTQAVNENGHIVGTSSIAVAFAQGAAMYQATRICILLERMAPKTKGVKEMSLFSVARLVMLVGLLTGRQQAEEQPDEEKGGKRGKRKRREGEDDDEDRRKRKKQKKDQERKTRGRKKSKEDKKRKRESVKEETEASSSSSSSESSG